MSFCVPDIAILFISLSSYENANSVIKKPLLGHINVALPPKLKENQKTEIINPSKRVPQDFINYEHKVAS